MNLPKGILRKLSVFTLSAFFISFGIDHFVNPEFYLSIMPPNLPLKLEAVYISGLFEILGGVGVLIASTRKIASLGLVALLVAVYPANIFMALNPERFPEVSIYVLYFRLILQFFFFYWAYSVSRPSFNPPHKRRT